MLQGPILGGIVRFAIPVALSGLLQQLFNAADTAVVGQFAPIGKLAVAAVSGNSFVINLMVSLFIGISVGANVQMATCNGRNDKEGMQRTLHTSLLFSLICGIVLMVVGCWIYSCEKPTIAMAIKIVVAIGFFILCFLFVYVCTQN